MAKERSPDRDEALKIWQESNGRISLKEIAQRLGVSEGTIRSWKNRDHWNATLQKDNCNVAEDSAQRCKKKVGPPFGSKNALGHGAPKGNKNALGNKGGAPKQNRNAVTHGQYRTIWLDCLSPEEQSRFEEIDTDAFVQVEQTIKMLSLLEYDMLSRLQKLKAGTTEKERKIISECKGKGQIINILDQETGHSKLIYRDKPELVITEITETEFRKIDDILKQEKALMDVQVRKGRQLELKHKLAIEQEKLLLEKKRVEIMARKVGDFGDEEDDNTGESYYDALRGEVGRVWSNDS